MLRRDAGADLFDLGRRQEAIGPRDVQKRQNGRDARRSRSFGGVPLRGGRKTSQDAMLVASIFGELKKKPAIC